MIKKAIILVSFICLSQLLMAQRDSTYFGVSLSGAEWGQPSETSFYPSTDLLDYYQSKGLRLIRLPIMWERIQPTLSSSLDATELGKLTTFVDAVASRNMKIIVDIHNYARYNGNIIGALTGVTTADVQDLWIRLATELKSKSCIWGYGIMNEPHDMTSITPWKDIAQSIIDGIRTVDQSTTIIVSGDSWSSAERWPTYSNNLKDLIDPNNNLIFEAHCYFDKDASGQYVNSYDADGVTTATGVNRVKPFVNWLKTNNLKGFIGEYGVPSDDDRWLAVLDSFMVYLKANHIGGTYWDCSNLNCDPVVYDAVQMAVLEKYATVIPVPGILSVSTNTVNISSVANSTASINVFSNTNWETICSPSQPWLIISPNQTTNGNAIINLTALENTTGFARTATLYVVATADNVSSQTITVTQTVGTGNLISELDNDNIFVYPNPASSSFSINNEDEASVEIYTSNSQLVLKTNVLCKESISLKDIPAGIYYVKIITNKTVVTRRLLVESPIQ